jgi:hypothetical protein
VAPRDDHSVWRSWLGFLFYSTGPIIFVLKLLFLVVVAIWIVVEAVASRLEGHPPRFPRPPDGDSDPSAQT